MVRWRFDFSLCALMIASKSGPELFCLAARSGKTYPSFITPIARSNQLVHNDVHLKPTLVVSRAANYYRSEITT